MATAKKSSKKSSTDSAKSPAKRQTKQRTKANGDEPVKRAPLPVVAFVGAHEAGVSTLAKRIANGATFKSHRANATIGGTSVVVRDVPGQARDESESDADMRRFDMLLDAIDNAAVIVHVMDASDRDAERIGGRMNRWIYGSWLDLRKPIITVFNKRDLATIEPIAKTLAEHWPHALSLSASTGDGVDALEQRLVSALTTTHVAPEGAPTVQGSLMDLQLALIERTKSATFDGPAIAKALRGMLAEGLIGAAHFLREGTCTYHSQSGALLREDNGLRFLSAIADDVWDADTLHVYAMGREDTIAKKLEALGPIEVERTDRSVLVARWSTEGVHSVAKPGAPTVQQIQLEIIRRGGYNAFRGDRVYAWLASHRSAWVSAAFGRLRTKVKDRRAVIESLTRFNTVTELVDDGWNADELWLVAPDAAAAERLRTVAQVHWFADNVTTLTEEEARRVAGVESPAQVVELWWD